MIHIVTLFAYSKAHPSYDNYLKLMRLWLYQVFNHTHQMNPCKVSILTQTDPQEVLQPLASMLKRLGDMEVVVVRKNTIPRTPFLFGFKLYNLGQVEEPFLYLDCDAIPLSNLNHLWKLRKIKPFIGTNHQIVKGHTDKIDPNFLNSGVLVVGDPSFCSFEKVFSTVSLNAMPNIPGGDQMILYAYCKALGYEYEHPLMDVSWNSCSALTKFLDVKKGEAVNNLDGKKVNINHYWANFKPWEIGCPLFQYFTQVIDAKR